MSDRPIIQILTDRQRVIGATRMFLDGKDAASVTEEDARAVIQQIEVYLNQHRELSRKKMARAIGYAPSVISEVLKMAYAGDWRNVILDLDRWLDQQIKADAAPTGTQFVWTEVAREIETVAKLVTQLRKIGLVYGPDTSGIGKTMALQALNQVIPGSVLITIDKPHANPTGLLRGIAVGLRIQHSRSNQWLYDRIVERLKGTPRLLMIDQIHNLRNAKDDRPFYYLTDIYDRTSSPQLWCGTADLVAYLRRGKAKGDESLAQIRRRITYVRDLMQRTAEEKDGGRGEPLVTIDQVREMFGQNKIRLAPESIRFLWSLACIPDSGSLGTCNNLVLIATITAEQLNRPAIDVPLLKAALRDSVQSETFENLINDSADFLKRIAKAG